MSKVEQGGKTGQRGPGRACAAGCDERRRAIEALRSIVYEDVFGMGSQELPADAA